MKKMINSNSDNLHIRLAPVFWNNPVYLLCQLRQHPQLSFTLTQQPDEAKLQTLVGCRDFQTRLPVSKFQGKVLEVSRFIF